MIKPCPFCGDDAVYVRMIMQEADVFCQECETNGPVHDREAKAIAAWNNRTPDPAVQALVDIASIASAHLHQLARDRDLSEGELDFMRRVDAALAAFDKTD